MSKKKQSNKLDKQALMNEITKAVQGINNNWSVFSKLAGKALLHFHQNSHNTDIAKHLYVELLKTNWDSLTQCYVDTMQRVAGIELGKRKIRGTANHEFYATANKQVWPSLSPTFEEKMKELLEGKVSIKSYRIQKKVNSNAKASNDPTKPGEITNPLDVFETKHKECMKFYKKIVKLDADNELVQDATIKLSELMETLKAEVNRLEQAKKDLAKSTGLIKDKDAA